MAIVGVPLGILIGVLSSIALLLLLNNIMSMKKSQWRTLVNLISELLSIPTFWFGGPWVTTKFLEDINLSELLGPYVVSLACTFVVMTVYPVVVFILRIGKEIGGNNG